MDQGVIAAVKVHYKREMVSKLVKPYSGDIEELGRLAGTTKQGRKGIRLGCKANILDAMGLIKKSYDALYSEAINNCWKHANCLPEEPMATVESMHCDINENTIHSSLDSVAELQLVHFSLFARKFIMLSIHLLCTAYFSTQASRYVARYLRFALVHQEAFSSIVLGYLR